MRRSHLQLIVGLAVSAGALYLLLAGMDVATLFERWSQLSAGSVVLAGTFLAGGYLLRVVRWWWMLRSFEPRLRLAHCVTPFVGSIALNNVLPLRAGDAVRAFGFRRQLGLAPATVLGTVVVERLLDLAMLLVLFFVGLSLASTDLLPAGMASAARWLGIGAAFVLIALPFAGPTLARRLAPVPGAQAPSGLQAARAGAAALLESFALLRSLSCTALLVPLTVLIWTLEGAVFAAIAADLAQGAPPAAAWFAMATGTLATLLPSTPGYVGTFDYFAMLGLMAFAVGRGAATAFSLTVHAVLWLPVTAVGLGLLAWHGGMTALRPSSTEPAARRATPT